MEVVNIVESEGAKMLDMYYLSKFGSKADEETPLNQYYFCDKEEQDKCIKQLL